MKTSRAQTYLRCVASFLVVFTVNSATKAEVFKDIAFGLGYVGFDIVGNHNPLSGGVDLLVTNTFVGNELDFGASDLTLQGPISMALTTGGRELSELEFSFRTAVDASSPASPLNYVFNYDTGAQSLNVAGTLFLDANVTLNSFGFYDLELQYSSRQTVTDDGRIANGSTDYDYDTGPIRVRGNWVADVLAFVTEPLFEAAGTTNPFESFSGSANLKQLLENQNRAAFESLAAGSDLDTVEAARLANEAVLNQVLRGVLSNAFSQTLSGGGLATANARVVPEPSVVILLILGVPAVLMRTRFWKSKRGIRKPR